MAHVSNGNWLSTVEIEGTESSMYPLVLKYSLTTSFLIAFYQHMFPHENQLCHFRPSSVRLLSDS